MDYDRPRRFSVRLFWAAALVWTVSRFVMWWLGKQAPNHAGNVGGKELPLAFSVDPIQGYRTWRVRVEDTYGLALHSLMQSYVWEVENTAGCLPSGPVNLHLGDAPSLDCACGLYVQKPDHPIDEWETHVRGRVRANGQVLLTGRVVVCERGYKAQHAEIMSPVFIDVDCGHKGCLRPVTKIQLEGSSDYWGWCDIHDGPDREYPMADAAMWMREALRQLHDRYPGITFLTFMEV